MYVQLITVAHAHVFNEIDTVGVQRIQVADELGFCWRFEEGREKLTLAFCFAQDLNQEAPKYGEGMPRYACISMRIDGVVCSCDYGRGNSGKQKRRKKRWILSTPVTNRSGTYDVITCSCCI